MGEAELSTQVSWNGGDEEARPTFEELDEGGMSDIELVTSCNIDTGQNKGKPNT